MGYIRFHFGSLYFGDKAKNVEQDPVRDGKPVPYDGISDVFIGKTEPGAAIHWIKPKGMNLFIANRVLMNNVSWNDLAKNSFVPGKKIIIDCQPFLCRLLQVGDEPNTPNEWDRVLDETGAANTLWHWNRYYFWGSDATKYNHSAVKNPYALRGCYGARARGSDTATTRRDSSGFRPALEVIASAYTGRTHVLEGQNFRISSVPGDKKIFCPILQPIKSAAFNIIPDGQQIKMYTLLENGQPHRMGDRLQNKFDLQITDKYFGDEFLIPWTISNGVAVADNALYQQE